MAYSAIHNHGRVLNLSGIRQTARANVSVRSEIPLIPKPDLACPQSIHKVERDPIQASPCLPPASPAGICIWCGWPYAARWHRPECPVLRKSSDMRSVAIHVTEHSGREADTCREHLRLTP